MSEKTSKQPTLPETEPAEEQAKKASRRPYAEDLRLMHKIDGVFEELSGEMDDTMMSFVLGRLCTQYAPPGFSFSAKVKE